MKKIHANFLQPSQQQLDSLLKYYQTGRYEDAEKLSVSITEEFPKHPFAWKVLSAVFKQMGKINESLVASQKSVQLDPQDAEAHSNLGVILQELGRLKEAEASYRKAITLKPDNAEAYYNLGNILKELGRLEEAQASYRQAIALKPDFTEAHSNLGSILQELGKLNEAEASCRQAITVKPDYAKAYSNLGNILQELGKLNEAQANYKQAIALKPDFAEAYDQLGVLLQNFGEFKGAEVCYKKCISLAPSEIPITKSMASALFAKGEFQKSLILFDSYNTPSSRSDALKSLYALGNTDEINKRIVKTVELDEGNLDVAAFATFIAESQKKHSVHRFCRKPLEFLHFSNLSSKIENSNLFITNLIEDLKNVRSKWQPPNQSANRGFQTVGNLFRYSNSNILTLKEIILNEIDLYYKKFQNEDCAFIKKWPTEKNIIGWHILLKAQGYHNFHIHHSGWLSGVIYLKIVPSLEKNEGAISFSVAGPNISNSDMPKIIHNPAVGDIVLFPSSLYHRTIPFSTDTDRIVVSFDLSPREKVNQP